MRAGWQGICAAAVATAGTVSAGAQSSRMSPEKLKRMESYTHVAAEVKAFAADYVAAWNAKDKARLEGLDLPESRACVTAANEDVYDAMMRAQWSDPVPPNYRLSLMPVNEGDVKALSSKGYFAVKPQRELHIDWQYPQRNDGGTVVVYLVQQNGRWRVDFPCIFRA